MFTYALVSTFTSSDDDDDDDDDEEEDDDEPPSLPLPLLLLLLLLLLADIGRVGLTFMASRIMRGKDRASNARVTNGTRPDEGRGKRVEVMVIGERWVRMINKIL